MCKGLGKQDWVKGPGRRRGIRDGERGTSKQGDLGTSLGSMSLRSPEPSLAIGTQNRTTWDMQTIPATRARAQLYKLIDAAAHEPVQITGKRGSAVLVSSEDWANIQETLHLLAAPGMAASIRRGLATPLGKTRKRLRW